MRTFIRNQPIKVKLVLITMLTCVVSLMLTGAIIVIYERYEAKKDLVRNLSAAGSLIAGRTSAALLFGDSSLAAENLASLRTTPSVRGAWVLDEQGRVFATYIQGEDQEIAPPSLPGNLTYLFDEGRLQLVEPVVLGGDRIGSVLIVADLSEFHRRWRYFLAVVAGAFMLSAALAIFLSSRLQSLVSTPVRELAKTAHEITSHGDYSLRGVKRSDDEIGVLVDAFNEMLAMVDRQNLEKRGLIQDLQVKKSMLDAILDTIPQAIFWKDLSNRYVGCNRAFAAFVGIRDPALLIGKKADLGGPLQAARKRFLNDAEFPAPGAARIHVVEAWEAEGDRMLWMDTSKLPLVNDHGQVVAVLGICEDITDRVLADQAIRESEAVYRYLFQQNPAPMLVYDCTSFALLRVNDAFVERYGYTNDEAKCMDLIRLSPEEERGPLLDRVRTLKGLAYSGEWHHLRKDGTVMTIEAWSHGLSYESHDARIEVIYDITERKKIEEALRQSEQRYKQLLESVMDYAYSVEIREGHVVKSLHGTGCEKVTGYTPADYAEDPMLWLAMVHPADRSVVEHYADPLCDGEEVAPLEHRIMHKNGKVRWVRNTYVPRQDQSGTFVGYDGLISDITERRLAEEEIRLLNADLERRVASRTAQLEAANTELEAFSYSVSHDLRAPLRHASGFVDLLLKRCKADLSEKGQHYLDSIADSVHQMGMLIDDLLQFSRTGRAEMRMSTTNMNALVADVVRTLQHDNVNRNIEWRIADVPSAIGDTAMLKLVWMNLLTNAVKFTRTHEHAVIQIEGWEQDGEHAFVVRDNGVGFDMKYAQKLFGVFQRLHRSEEFEGTGIGLANVRRIVLRHGGRVWAEGEIEKGAAFYFTLPKQHHEAI